MLLLLSDAINLLHDQNYAARCMNADCGVYIVYGGIATMFILAVYAMTLMIAIGYLITVTLQWLCLYHKSICIITLCPV